jgi:hypothetical protein
VVALVCAALALTVLPPLRPVAAVEGMLAAVPQVSTCLCSASTLQGLLLVSPAPTQSQTGGRGGRGAHGPQGRVEWLHSVYTCAAVRQDGQKHAVTMGVLHSLLVRPSAPGVVMGCAHPPTRLS